MTIELLCVIMCTRCCHVILQDRRYPSGYEFYYICYIIIWVSVDRSHWIRIVMICPIHSHWIKAYVRALTMISLSDAEATAKKMCFPKLLHIIAWSLTTTILSNYNFWFRVRFFSALPHSALFVISELDWDFSSWLTHAWVFIRDVRESDSVSNWIVE